MTPAVDNCASVEDEDCDGAKTVCTGNHLFSKALDNAIVYGLATDAAGNIGLIGYADGTINLDGTLIGTSGQDVFIAKLQPNGNLAFGAVFSDATYDQGEEIAFDGSGNILATGHFRGSIDFGGDELVSANTYGADIFVVKLDGTGTHLWSKRFGGIGNDQALAIAADSAGAVYVAGDVGSEVDFGGGLMPAAGLLDAFLVKLDAAGTHLWSKRFGNAQSQSAFDVTVDASGNVLVVGTFDGTLDFGGGPLSAVGQGDVFVAKFSSSGAHLWSKRYGDGGYQVGGALAAAPGDHVMVAGHFNGAIDFGGGVLVSIDTDAFVAQLDAAGNHVWSARYGGASNQIAESVAVDGGGNVVIGGHFFDTIDFGGGTLASAGGDDAFLAKLTASGAHVWSKRFGDADQQIGSAVAVTTAGLSVFGGRFAGTVSFGGTAFTANVSNGSIDGFVGAYAP